MELSRETDTDFCPLILQLKRGGGIQNDRFKHTKKCGFNSNFWLHEQAEAAAADGNLKKKIVLKAIKEHEPVKELFKKLRAVLSPKDFGGLMSLLVPASASDGSSPSPEDATEWLTVNDPVEFKQQIIEESKRHFTQDQGSPFTREPF